jgi:catechol 2,3-dioxygenase-like lactoylglutathione lyase family enzyme
MKEIEFILYVADQAKSKEFYTKLFQLEPSLDVPGMTEFLLAENVKLGLMPENGIAKILGNKTHHPNRGNGIPRCELYLKVENPLEYFKRGIRLGGAEISSLLPRDWGDRVAYISDLDGHVIAFAAKLT